MGALFGWDRLVTPGLVKSFYWMNVVLVVIVGLFGITAALAIMRWSPTGGFVYLLLTLLGMTAGIVVARMFAELVLVFFRLRDDLEALRRRLEP